MELWIRTQSKLSLIKVNNICIRDDNTIINCADSFSLKNYAILGTYETKERALEVLDEIQEKLTIRKINETSGIEYILCQDLVPIIYEMPQE